MSPEDKNPSAESPAAPTSGSSVLPPEAERQLKEDVSAALDTARKEIRAVADEAGHEAGEVMEQARAEIGKAADKAKGMAAEQKEFASRQIEDIAEAVSKVAGELEANNAAIATHARALADAVANFSDTFRNKDVDELLALAQDFGRRQPIAFMGAAALMGFAASRFLMASSGNRRGANRSAESYLGDGGISGNYPGPSRRPAREASTTTRDTMGGTI